MSYLYIRFMLKDLHFLSINSTFLCLKLAAWKCSIHGERGPSL